MPVALVNASSVGRDFSSSETSMYWVQLDQLTTFSVSLMSWAAFAEAEAEPDGVPPVPSLPQAVRAAVAPSPRAPVMTARRLVSPRIRAARAAGEVRSGVRRSAMGVSSRGWCWVRGWGGAGGLCGLGLGSGWALA